MQCWEKKCKTVCFKLRICFYNFHNSAESTGQRSVQSGGLLCWKLGVMAKTLVKRVLWHKGTQGHRGWEQSRCGAQVVTDGHGVPGSGKWCLLGKWLSQLELLMDKDKSCHFHIICQVHFQRHKSQYEGKTFSRRMSQWPVAALTTQENPALLFTFRLELIKTPGAFAEDWPGRHIYHTQISKASKAMGK